ncbi:MAG: hypothetical protein FWF91_03200 [Coriobacteriia bacterium]|nr:hypothetical protein [Coriobacteriia bacterium]
MRTIDLDNNDIKAPDLRSGQLVEATVPRKGAMGSIDHVTKFGLEPEDYETVKMYIPDDPKMMKDTEVALLKAELALTDLKALRRLEELYLAEDAEYRPIFEQREGLRDEMSRLE